MSASASISARSLHVRSTKLTREPIAMELLSQTDHNISFNPTWHETKFLLINTLTEVLSLNVLDYNDHRKDSNMGAATFELSKLQEDAIQEHLMSSVFKDGKERGELRYDM